MLTIITVTYNNYEELLKTVGSIKLISEQVSFELIVINGGVCKKTRKFLEEFSPSYYYKYICEEDRGIADAFNKGIKLSIGDYVVFLNSGDCLLDDNYFCAAIKFLDFNKNIDFVCGDILFNDDLVGEIVMSSDLSKPIGAGMICKHQSLIVRKIVFDKYGYFDVSYKIGMDYEWLCRIWKNSRGHYLSSRDNPSIWMDGQGVSNTQEASLILECRQALEQNNLLDRSNLWEWRKRYLKFLTRRYLGLIGLAFLLKLFKKIKYASIKNEIIHLGK